MTTFPTAANMQAMADKARQAESWEAKCTILAAGLSAEDMERAEKMLKVAQEVAVLDPRGTSLTEVAGLMVRMATATRKEPCPVCTARALEEAMKGEQHP